jgi:hypothetical protein
VNILPTQPKKVIKISQISSLSKKAKWDVATPHISTTIPTSSPSHTSEEAGKITTTTSTSTADVETTTISTTALPETHPLPFVEPKVDPLKEEQIVGKQKSIEPLPQKAGAPPSTSSVEVAAAGKSVEKSHPSDKDYENVEEATMELMKSLAGMMEGIPQA